ncbi:MAG: hypothetical protein M3525_07660 [Acidobacteriota bacterium]|nr:hypothetical protein [Acidobacteriota bacterium]
MSYLTQHPKPKLTQREAPKSVVTARRHNGRGQRSELQQREQLRAGLSAVHSDDASNL